MGALLNDLRALELMVERGMFERGVSRIGAEQEIFIVDGAYHPAPGALRILEKIDDPHYTTELGLFNLEINADPQPFGGKGLSAMEAQISALYAKVRTVAAPLDPELEEFWRKLGFVVIQGYGLTETAALVTLNHPFHISRGSVGKALPGREVKIGEDGEILVRGEMLARIIGVGLIWRNSQ